MLNCSVLGLLIWNRPYERRSGNVINIVIQVVRALSIVCILVFVEELGIAQTTQTVTGVVLIAVQSSLTAILAILIAVNAIIICCKENPHRKRRKEAGRFQSVTLLRAVILTSCQKNSTETLTTLPRSTHVIPYLWILRKLRCPLMCTRQTASTAMTVS